MRVVILVIAVGACGRVAFDPLADGARADSTSGASDSAIDAVAFDPANCPPSYTETFASTGHRYRRELGINTWLGALAACRGDQISPLAPTHMITLDSDAERIEMASGQAANTPWLGHSDRVTEGMFVPITLENVNGYPIPGSASWFPGEPNNSGGIEHCIDMKTDGTLNDVDCTVSKQFTCECDPYLDTPSQY